MGNTLFTAGDCPRCKITVRAMHQQGIALEQLAVKAVLPQAELQLQVM